MITPSDVPSRWRKKSPNGFRCRLRLFSCSMGRLKESSPVILLLLLFPLLLHQSLTKYLTPFVERERYQIPDKCRLHPDNDLYRDQEQHKVHVDVYEWKCGYCRKSFNEDKFLDQHFATRHFNLLNTTGTKCLADLCGALHCDFVLSSKKAKSKCNPAAAAKNRVISARVLLIHASQ
ncbi:PREDICTED: uncharacterized protein LOC106293642 [Brassica oleracea var. oleracea]|uniref:uncharacterized protein LOC106293642 n=1 Tax=Brassica oleracea var. oleracea TaxID=109376 RepID=UPI0006A6FAE7|nr:PREDICTED: uncharacterized protein LOC106293642 [Brassica oleracea var. oleracea]